METVVAIDEPGLWSGNLSACYFFFLTIWSQYAFVRTRLLFILDFVQGERWKSVERLRGMHERSMEISQDHQGEGMV